MSLPTLTQAVPLQTQIQTHTILIGKERAGRVIRKDTMINAEITITVVDEMKKLKAVGKRGQGQMRTRGCQETSHQDRV